MYDEANNSMKTTNTTKKTWRRRTESNECAKRTAKRFMFTLNLFALLVTNLFESCVGDGFQGMFSGATTFQKKYECDSMVSGSPNSCVCKGENCYLTDGNFHLAVEKCLEEAPRDGLCSKWGTNSTNYGVMPKWDTSRVTNMDGKLGSSFTGFGGRAAFNGDLSTWNTGQVTSMKFMFAKAAKFNKDISKWDTSSVRDMTGMFDGAIEFNQNIGRWNTSQVLGMNEMFNGALEFDHHVNTWEGPAALSLQANMFLGAKAFIAKYKCADSLTGPPSSCSCLSSHCLTDETFHIAVEACLMEDPVKGLCSTYGLSRSKFGTMPEWDTHLVTSMIGYTDDGDIVGFAGKSTFNSDISRWITSQVTTMRYMFAWTAKFNADIGNWDTSRVKDMQSVFEGSSSFDRDISRWDTSSVTNMDAMFYQAVSFDSDVSG